MSKTNNARRYVIVGPGAVGGSIAIELHKAGIPVIVVARGIEHETIAARGIRYLTPGGEEFVRVESAGSPADVVLSENDVLVLATKSQDTEVALREWAWQPVVKADGTIGSAAQDLPLLTLQNSITNERTALRWFRKVYGGVLAFPVDKKDVAEVTSYSSSLLGLIWFGTYPQGSDEFIESVAADFGRARLGTAVVDNIANYKATKLAYNTVNSIEPVFAPSDLRDELKQSLHDEAWDVLSAAGFSKVELWDADTGLNHDLLVIGEVEGEPRSGNSTWQSYQRGATVETDFLNGDIVLLGRLHGVPTPLNEAVQVAIREVLAGRRPVRAGDDALSEFVAAAHGAPVSVGA